MMIKKIFAGLTLFGFTLGGKAQSISTDSLLGQVNTITTAVPFLMIAPDSRHGGMGDAGVASSPDVNSIHWNASKLAFAEKQFGIGVSYTPWLRQLVDDINLAYLSGFYKLDKKTPQALAFSLRYFSLGNITFTDVVGNTIGDFKPNEFAIDVAYATKLSDNFSVGMAARYINSNLTNGVEVGGSATRPGRAFAVDISSYYNNKEIEIGGKKSSISAGLNISNIGSKISYSTRSADSRDFIPINMKLGSALTIQPDDYNLLTFMVDFNKLLVPTPPVYFSDSLDIDGNPVIQAGKDPNVSVAQGMIQSFSDAPGGFKEELREINPSIGFEYWYDKQFAFRMGYFHEHPTKGNRQYFTVGAGLRYNVFGLDFAYLIPSSKGNQSPLKNTLRFTLTFDFDAFKDQNDKATPTD